MPILLTMGPRIGILPIVTTATVGHPGEIRFIAVGAAGDVKWRLVNSELPPEWDNELAVSGDSAILSTDEAINYGTFGVSVLAVDQYRVPVTVTAQVFVFNPAPTGLNLIAPWSVPVGDAADINLTETWEH